MAVDRKRKEVKSGECVPGNNEYQEIDRYGKGKSFEQKVGEIFKSMGFEVAYNRSIAGNEIDILIKRKRRFGSRNEGYICECKNRIKKVTKNEVLHYATEQKAIINYSREQNIDDFDLMIVSSSGFTDNAKQTAESLGVILKTYNEILSELMDFDTYLTSLINDFEGSDLQRLYIQPDFFTERKREVINGFKFVEEWLKQPESKQFSLLGDHGTGKTSFAKVLTYKMATAYKKEPEKNRVPFLVDLKECKGAFSLKNLLKQNLESGEVEPPSADKFLKLLAEGHVLLIFDAFDEMATVSSGETTLSNFKQLNEAVRGNAKVILTSRTHYFRDKDEVERILKQHEIDGISHSASRLMREISGKSEYEIVHIKEFSDTHVQEYLQKAMGNEWKTAYQKIKSTFNLNDLCYHPVLLDMIVKT
ncbi:MAG: NACHT domain-containing protein, partial [Candidatus Aminicenantes bacterium]